MQAMPRKPRLLGSVVLLLACMTVVGVPRPAAAHGAVRARIARLSARIDRNPNDAKLYLARARLELTRERPQQALEDLQRARELDETLREVDVVRARALLAMDQADAALAAVDGYLRTDSPIPQSHRVRGEALLALARFSEAETEFERYVGLEDKPDAETFLLYAEAIARQGDENIPRALIWLDRGIMRLDKIRELPLHRRVVELNVRKGDTFGALARLDEVLAETKQKAPWLALRGDVLAQAGRHAEAREAYTACLRALTGTRQPSDDQAQLRDQVEAKLQALPE